MSDRERRLRAEVLLLVNLAESREDSLIERVGLDGDFDERVSVGGRLISDSTRHELEGALGAAVAAHILTDGQVEWVRRLARGYDEPESRPDVSPDRRAELDRLLERLAHETVAAGRSPEASHAHVRFHDAVRTADSLGLLSDDQRRHWDRRIAVLHGDDYVDPAADGWEGTDAQEPLLGLKAVLPGLPERNGRQVVSIECYDGGLVVRWKASHELPEELRDDPRGEARFVGLHEHVDITDDAGTDYGRQGGGGGSRHEGGRLVSSWRDTFTSGVAPEARTLAVHVGEERFEFDVTGVAERPAV